MLADMLTLGDIWIAPWGLLGQPRYCSASLGDWLAWVETSPEQEAAGILEYGPGTSKMPAVEDEEALGLGVVR